MPFSSLLSLNLEFSSRRMSQGWSTSFNSIVSSNWDVILFGWTFLFSNTIVSYCLSLLNIIRLLLWLALIFFISEFPRSPLWQVLLPGTLPFCISCMNCHPSITYIFSSYIHSLWMFLDTKSLLFVYLSSSASSYVLLFL